MAVPRGPHWPWTWGPQTHPQPENRVLSPAWMGMGMGSSPKDAGKGLDREAVSDMYITEPSLAPRLL